MYPSLKLNIWGYVISDKVRQVFQEGEFYRLKPLNSHWEYKAEYVHVEKAETIVIAESSRKWLNERWQVRKQLIVSCIRLNE